MLLTELMSIDTHSHKLVREKVIKSDRIELFSHTKLYDFYSYVHFSKHIMSDKIVWYVSQNRMFCQEKMHHFINQNPICFVRQIKVLNLLHQTKSNCLITVDLSGGNDIVLLDKVESF